MSGVSTERNICPFHLTAPDRSRPSPTGTTDVGSFSAALNFTHNQMQSFQIFPKNKTVNGDEEEDERFRLQNK